PDPRSARRCWRAPFSGLVGIASSLASTVASPSLSSQRVVLIHQFDECHGVVSLSHGKRQRDQYDNSSCALRSASPKAVRVEVLGAEDTSTEVSISTC